jgi:DNA-binding MurR/RpiR family transcriptional regulator
MIGERIAEKMPVLSPGQKAIARFLLDNSRDAAFLTASQLGEVAGVSESTVVRFASLLGYTGYPQMRSAVRDLLIERFSTLERLRDYDRAQEGNYLHRAIAEDIRTLSEAQALVDTSALEALGAMIVNAEQVMVAGHRSSRALAHYLCYYLSWLFRGICLLDPETAFEKVANASRKSLVIGISFPRYTSWTLEILRFSSQSGMHTASITNDFSSPLATWSEVVVTVPWKPLSFIDSVTAPMSVINCVILAAAKQLGEPVTEKLERLEQIWSRNRTYVRPMKESYKKF